MEGENYTLAGQFLIVGFSDLPKLQIPLFLAFTLIYLITLIGNLLIMSIIYSSPHLHRPMYFFLMNLSFIDISCISVTFPQMLAHFFLKGALISLSECLLQVYCFVFLLGTEFLLLTFMAFDRYVAICNPLHYRTMMNNNMCIQLIVVSWAAGLMIPLPHTVLMSQLSYCQSHTINHFFCDISALMTLSCTKTHIFETINYIVGSIFALAPFIFVITSYVKVISVILKMKSTEGRHKAFSTCGSHLTVVILFYGSVCPTYMRPTSLVSLKENKILSLFYTTLPPMCNPIIYSLNNREFKNVLWKKKKEYRLLQHNIVQHD
ncbi:olfactory receptor 8D1-like [Pleurodeles waltl]|uniref:olfactory receptor 8D1-like n=1 Tax=Pleurodeles waltl TaxID=8319 RepID=UPI003709BC64